MENSVKVNAGSRTFYFDACADKQGNKYISIAEVPINNKRQRHRIFIYEEDLEKFREGLNAIIKVIQNGNKS